MVPKLEYWMEQFNKQASVRGQNKTLLQRQQEEFKVSIGQHKTIDHHLYKIKTSVEELEKLGRTVEYSDEGILTIYRGTKDDDLGYKRFPDVVWDTDKGHWVAHPKASNMPSGACEHGFVDPNNKEKHPCVTYPKEQWLFVHEQLERLMRGRYNQMTMEYQPALHGMPCSLCGVVLDPYWDNRKYREKYVCLYSRYLKDIGAIDRVSRY